MDEAAVLTQQYNTALAALSAQYEERHSSGTARIAQVIVSRMST